MKANELKEAAKIAAARYCDQLDGPCYDKSFYEGFLAGAEYALSHLWRELTKCDCPIPEQDVMIYGETGDIIVARIVWHNGVQKWFPEVKCRVTHWMPIPQPPKPEEK